MGLAAIEWDKVGELLWVAPIAALAVTVTYSMVILGVARAGEARRAGDGGSALAFSALAVGAGLVFAAIVVASVVVIAHK